MYSRNAFIMGKVAPDSQATFNRVLETEVLPLIRSMPGVAQAHIHFSAEFDTDAPDVYGLLTIYYNSRNDMEVALGSPIRAAMQEHFRSILPALEGKVVHINSMVA